MVADYGGDNADWGDQNPSVFQMTIVNTLRGEYQLTNGYGPEKAPQVLKVKLATTSNLVLSVFDHKCEETFRIKIFLQIAGSLE